MADRRRRNWLLKALAQEEYESLQPHLEEVDLPLGTFICESGAELAFAYFPESCVVSIVAVLEDGMTPEMTTIGPEGVVGLAAMLGKPESFGRYIVQLPGRASRIRLVDLQAAAVEHPRMRDTMFLYLHWVIARALQLVACNAVHPVEARCARWILMLHDCLEGERLPLTHEFLAVMLGVQRPTVTVVTRTFQTAGFIRQHRGAITVTDEAGLEEAACECYGHIRRRLERLFPGHPSAARVRSTGGASEEHKTPVPRNAIKITV